MPPQHQAITGWNDQRLLDWARSIESSTEAAVCSMLHRRKHPQQSYRACLGVLRLAKDFINDRLNTAFARALKLNAISYRSIQSILKHGLDKQQPAKSTQISLPLNHENVRGSDYYH